MAYLFQASKLLCSRPVYVFKSSQYEPNDCICSERYIQQPVFSTGYGVY